MLTAVRTVFRHKILVAAAATVVAGGVTAGFVVPALAASSPAATSPAPSNGTTPATKPSHRRGPVRVLALRLARETMHETGVNGKTLLQDLRAGQTLDQIAGAKASAVVDAVVETAQSRLDALVKTGRITADEEQLRLARLRCEANEIMGMNLAPFLPAAHGGGAERPSSTPAATAA